MSDTELKPCPFCGGKVIIEDIGEGDEYYMIACKNPTCNGSFCFGERGTKKDFIRAYNTRKPMERIVEQLEEQQNKNRYENHHDGWNVGIDQVIEIVQKGGAE